MIIDKLSNIYFNSPIKGLYPKTSLVFNMNDKDYEDYIASIKLSGFDIVGELSFRGVKVKKVDGKTELSLNA